MPERILMLRIAAFRYVFFLVICSRAIYVENEEDVS